MKINTSVFENVKAHNAQVLCVTKYWDGEMTKTVLDFGLESYPEVFLGIGENRTKQLREKDLPRDNVHFVGNLQSRQLKEIVLLSNTIHSVHKFSHVQKLEELVTMRNLPLNIFLQVNISQEPQKGGILPREFPSFVEALSTMNNPLLDIMGISAIGAGEFDVSKKVQEFKGLRALRDQYLPDKKISAGTSRDYEIALGEGIDIVRVGSALIE